MFCLGRPSVRSSVSSGSGEGECETRDSLADGAVSSELLSPPKFPDKQGENRELSISGLLSRDAHAEWSRIYKGFLTEFPTQPNREF